MSMNGAVVFPFEDKHDLALFLSENLTELLETVSLLDRESGYGRHNLGKISITNLFLICRDAISGILGF